MLYKYLHGSWRDIIIGGALNLHVAKPSSIPVTLYGYLRLTRCDPRVFIRSKP